MPVTLEINDIPFEYPEVGDEDWGQAGTGWATAVSSLLEQMRSATAPIADAGQLRLGNEDEIAWRNAADDDNVLVYVDSDDRLYYKNGADPAIDLVALAGGNVTGPLSSTDEAVARFNGISGQIIQNSLVLISDLGNVSGVVDLAMTGDITAVNDIVMSGNLSGAALITTADLTVTDDADLVDLDASGAIIFSGTSGHSVSEEFANEVFEEYARPTGSTVGVRGVAISSSSGAFNTDNTTFTAVTNLSVTLTTTGRPVMIKLQGNATGSTIFQLVGVADANGAHTMNGFIKVIRNGATSILEDLCLNFTQEINDQPEQFAMATDPGAVSLVDVVTAGTHTYTVEVMVGSAGSFSSGPTIHVEECHLVAYEL